MIDKPEFLEIGAKVAKSPVGSGRVTDITLAGYPKVNDVAVGWLVLEGGGRFDPHGRLEEKGAG